MYALALSKTVNYSNGVENKKGLIFAGCCAMYSQARPLAFQDILLRGFRFEICHNSTVILIRLEEFSYRFLRRAFRTLQSTRDKCWS